MMATTIFLSLLFLLLSSLVSSEIIKRDEHNLIYPLSYSPESQLLTASVSIGTPASTYNLIVDTGSPFLVVETGNFHNTTSTYDPDPTSEEGGGYMTTNPDPRQDAGNVQAKMHFMIDTGFLNEGSGERAGGGVRAGNLSVGLSDLGGQLRGANGILGLSPPTKNQGVDKAAGEGDGGGAEEHGEGNGGEDKTFLSSFLSPSHRKILGIEGDNQFYLTFSPTNPPTGQLVFPLSGTTLPPSIPGFSYTNAISIDPTSGSTFPKHPFYGIAHRSDLSFFLDSTTIPDIRIDALLFDSGTSGIIAPPSEVAKIFNSPAASRISTLPSPQGSGVVMGKTNCGEKIKMGFGFGDKRASFVSVRPKPQSVPNRFRLHENENMNPSEDAKLHPLLTWKSYVDAGVNAYLQGVNNALGMIGLNLKKRGMVKMQKRTFFLFKLLGQKVTPPPPPPPPTGGGDEDKEGKEQDLCDITLVGSPQVEQMFPANGKDFKPWILGMEFFQSNLMYFNLDQAMTVVLPREE